LIIAVFTLQRLHHYVREDVPEVENRSKISVQMTFASPIQCPRR
jgi:hypothetical protein